VRRRRATGAAAAAQYGEFGNSFIATLSTAANLMLQRKRDGICAYSHSRSFFLLETDDIEQIPCRNRTVGTWYQ
jgi:hypothetical protein